MESYEGSYLTASLLLEVGSRAYLQSDVVSSYCGKLPKNGIVMLLSKGSNLQFNYEIQQVAIMTTDLLFKKLRHIFHPTILNHGGTCTHKLQEQANLL